MSSTAVDRSPVGIAALAVPLVAVVALAATWSVAPPAAVLVLLGLLLAGSVLSAVHPAPGGGHRGGGPVGGRVRGVGVTVVEVGLILSLTLSGKAAETLARDTVFAAVMITCNGILGLVLLLGALRRRVAVFNREGVATALTTVLALAVLSLVLPTFTTTTRGPVFSPSQLGFAAVASLGLYVLFVFVQSVRHRDYFLPAERSFPQRDDHADLPSARRTLVSLGLLVASLVAVVGLAKVESPAIEGAVEAAGLPAPFVGVVIAVLVLLPETLAATRNARRDRVQIGLNLALGSAMASIGLTVPVLAVVSIFLPGRLTLGLDPVQIVLLALTAAVGVLTTLPGRATVLQGAVHLAVCAAFLWFAAVP